MLKKLYDLFIYLRYKDYIDIKLLELFGDEYIKNPNDYKTYKQALINQYKNHNHDFNANITIKPSKNILVKKMNYKDIEAIKQNMNPGDILIIKNIDDNDNKTPSIFIYNGPSLYAKLKQDNIKGDKHE